MVQISLTYPNVLVWLRPPQKRINIFLQTSTGPHLLDCKENVVRWGGGIYVVNMLSSLDWVMLKLYIIIFEKYNQLASKQCKNHCDLPGVEPTTAGVRLVTLNWVYILTILTFDLVLVLMVRRTSGMIIILVVVNNCIYKLPRIDDKINSTQRSRNSRFYGCRITEWPRIIKIQYA